MMMCVCEVCVQCVYVMICVLMMMICVMMCVMMCVGDDGDDVGDDVQCGQHVVNYNNTSHTCTTHNTTHTITLHTIILYTPSYYTHHQTITTSHYTQSHYTHRGPWTCDEEQRGPRIWCTGLCGGPWGRETVAGGAHCPTDQTGVCVCRCVVGMHV